MEGPTLPVVPAADPAGPEAMVVLSDDSIESGPVGRQTEITVLPEAVDGETAASAVEAVVAPVTPAADLPGPVISPERASASVSVSLALVSGGVARRICWRVVTSRAACTHVIGFRRCDSWGCRRGHRLDGRPVQCGLDVRHIASAGGHPGQ